MDFNNFSKTIKEDKYNNRENQQMDRFIDSIKLEKRTQIYENERDLFNQSSTIPVENNIQSNVIHNVNSNNNNTFENEYYEFNNYQNDKNIEKGIVEYEFFYNLQKKSFFNINTPFSLSFVWKIILLLSKYPSNQKLLKMLNIQNTNSILQKLKNNNDLFNNYSHLNIVISNNSFINKDVFNKLNNILNISISNNNNMNKNIFFNIYTNYNLIFPKNYKSKIISKSFENKNIKNKFIQLENIYVSIIFINNVFHIEIPLLNETIGFIYTNMNKNTETINYDDLINTKTTNYFIKKIIFPKFTTNKEKNYGIKFNKLLNDFHLGELIYGSLFDLSIYQFLNLKLSSTDEIKKNNIQNVKILDFININHSHFFYIKKNNQIIISGFFENS